MARLTRKQALQAIKAAGATGDDAAFARLYVENRISYGAARAAFAAGQRFAGFVAERDALQET